MRNITETKSNQVKVEDFPTGWQVRTFGELTENLDYKRIPLSKMQRASRKGRYPYYGASGVIDFVDDYIFDGKHLLVSEDGENLRSRKEPISFIVEGKFWVNNHAHVLKANASSELEFLNYWLSGNGIAPYLSGSVQPKLSQVNLNNIKITCPSVSEQQQIVSILSSLDNKIELNGKMGKTLEETGRTLFKRWFIDFEFPNENRKPYKSSGGKLVDSKLGKIPNGWRVEELGKVLNFAYGKALQQNKRQAGPVPVYGSSGVVGWHDQAIARAPGIVIGRKGNVGSIFWVDYDFYPIDTTFYIETDQNLYYVFYALHMSNFVNSDSAVPGLSRQQVYQNPWVCPDKEILNRFESVVKPIFNQIKILKEDVDLLAQVRDSLLPKLMGGKIRIK